MNTTEKLFSLLLVCLLVLPSFAIIDKDLPTITEVSTIAGLHKGSEEGGTILIIKGTSFNPVFSKNAVWVGSYVCEMMADGSTEDSLSCRTTYPYDENQKYNLPIRVAVDGKSQVTCSSDNCKYSYHWDQTPQVQEICPRSAIPGELVTIFGTHRIIDIGDALSDGEGQIQELRIGNNICSIIDVDQKTSIEDNQRQPINCRIAQQQEAGEYSFSEVVDTGNARLSVRTQQTSFLTGNNYTQRSVPLIREISSHQGGHNGHTLKVQGWGFGSDISSYECSIAGEQCTVQSFANDQVTVQVPAKDSGNIDFGKLAQHGSDSQLQEKPYIGGGGALYSRFDRNGIWKADMEEWFQFLQTSHGMTLMEQKILSQLSSPQIYDIDDEVTNYIEHIRGYFYAHTDGQYTFTGNCDDTMIMKLSKYPNTANLAHSETLILIEKYNYHHFLPFTRQNQTATTATKNLQEGYYYFEIVLLNGGGSGFFKIDAQIPQFPSIPYTINPTWATKKITIKPSTYTAEEIELTVTGKSGTFKLFYNELQNGQWITYTATMNVGDPAYTVKDKLYSLPNMRKQREVQLLTFNADGNPQTDSSLITKYIYTIKILDYRNQDISMPLVNYDQVDGEGIVTPSVTINQVVKHSAPLSGSFKVLVDGNPLVKHDGSSNFVFNQNPWHIGNSLNQLFGTREIQSYRVMDTNAQDQVQIIIDFAGLAQSPGEISINTALMQGGDSSSMTSSVESIREYSTKPLYSPVPYDFLHVPSQKPTLNLKYKSIPAVCNDCSYEIDSSVTATIDSYSRSAQTITIALSDPAAVGFVLDDITVSLLETPCISLSGTISSFTCTLSQNTDDSVQLQAGNEKVKVHISQIGFADDSAVSQEDIDMTITMSPAVATEGGLITGSLSGSGLPLNSETADDLSISICGNQVAQIISITNQVVEFTIPSMQTACSGSNSLISFNGKTSTITFAYDNSVAPTITSLSKASASPIMKDSLTIIGSNFGDSSNTKVYLYQKIDGKLQQMYELATTSVTSTQIDCILGGGKTGQYKVVVINLDSGASTPDTNSKFRYGIFVSDVKVGAAFDQQSGHKGGGYDMKITGENFATASGSSHVFIGTALNQYCEITSISETEIICTVPRMSDQYSVGQDLEVVVTGRIIEESSCVQNGHCTFSYHESGTPTISSQTLIQEVLVGQKVTIAGTGLSGSTVQVGGQPCEIQNNTDNLIIFSYPNLKSGKYEIIIENSNGRTYPEVQSQTPLLFYNFDSQSGSEAGNRVILTGNGFPEQNKIIVGLRCSEDPQQLQIVEALPNKIVFEIPPFNGNQVDRRCIINATEGSKSKISSYTYTNNETTVIQVSDLGANVFQIKETQFESGEFTSVQFRLLDSGENPTSSRYPMTISSLNDTHTNVVPSGGYLPAGKFKVYALKPNGYATPVTITVSFPSTPTASQVTSSFLGGQNLTIDGQGFVTIEPQNNDIRVCGLRAQVLEATQSKVIIKVPALITETTQAEYSIAEVEIISGTPYSDDSQKAQKAFDGSYNTFYGSQNSPCYIGYDFGENMLADVKTIKFVPNHMWVEPSAHLEGAIFQGSNDGTNWSQIFEVDVSEVHSSWNTWIADSSHKYRYVRFSHTVCELAEIEIQGFKYSTQVVVSGGDKNCDVNIVQQSINLADKVVYRAAATSTVTDISKSFGPSVGGDSITITGTNFGSSLSVLIDDIECIISSSSATEITCTTGLRSSPPAEGNSFIVISDGSPAKVNTEPYFYGDRWSEQATWGGEALPREGDTVYVPKGMTLVVDVDSTPILESILVEGKIIFSDEKAMKIDAKYFLIVEGQFQAGTQINNYQNQLTITLHGGYYQKQLPTFGNKVLGCLNCVFNMHGKYIEHTWTQLASTVNIGDTSMTVLHSVDWQPGQKIAVATSTFDHQETQQMTIQSVSGTTITVVQQFKHKHYAAVQTYGSEDFVMRAEVGLISRNIKVQGNQDSEKQKYGSHLMLTGREANGLIGKVAYAEFTKCGQPAIVGRYCTHFHMAGQVHKSYVRGIAVHHSFARVLTIHGTHYLTVEKNVGYHVQGHNIFVEDGIETHNVIQDNLMMSSIVSHQMLQSDVTVASYWITNPSNIVRRNHAAGGDFYGFWYEIKEHPDGPSATKNICPMGMKLGESKDNVAHSYKRFGLRIFKLSARKFPCNPPKDEHAQDPYASNPAYESVFENYTLWRNEECGFLGEELGYTTIRNIRTADSRKGGMQFHKTNYTKELVVAQNCLVVGISQGNAPDNLEYYYKNARGVIASRTDGLKFDGISFHNFESFMTPLQSCSECWSIKLWVTGGKTTQFNNISYTNINGKYIFWENWRRQIFIDLDGTLTNPFQSAVGIAGPQKSTLTPYRPSLMIDGHCYEEPGTDNLWNSSILCDDTIVLRGILFTNALPQIDFNAIDIKATLLDPLDPFEDISQKTEEEFSAEYMVIIKKSKDIKNSWAMPFATNQYYNIHWKWGIDFTHLAIAPSRLWDDNDGVVLRFNYTDQRELFDILEFYGSEFTLFSSSEEEMISPNNCTNGQYYHHTVNYSIPENQNASEYLFVCVSGRQKSENQWIDLNGIRCRYDCPDQQQNGQRQGFQRFWSNKQQWPGQELPKEGDNVTIPYEWQLVLDVDTPILNYLQIKGILRFSNNESSLKLQANYIWVSQGILRAGSAEQPYDKQANIILHGQKSDRYLLIDPDASGNKMLAVTGGLQLYGIEPQTTWTRLTTTAVIGAQQIQVEQTTGWEVGDKLVIAPSYSGRKDFEEVQITHVNHTTNKVKFSPSLEKEHYGAGTSTISNDFGQLDTRSAVGLLNRNIKISAGEDPNNWGCRVLIYGYLELDETYKPVQWRNGYGKIHGVEFDRCGQYDTTYAALRIENLGQNEGSPNDQNKTQVQASSFHNCGGFCMYIDDSMNISVNNNVMFWARKFIVYVEDIISDYNFTNNLMIGARKRDEVDLSKSMLVDDISCYQQYFKIDYKSDHRVNVTDNLCQGSEGQGFVFPMIPCDLLDSYPFIRNTAGSCEVAFMYEKLDGQQCLAAKGAIGYASAIGLMANPPGSHKQLIYDNMFFADNQRGITLRYAHDVDENSLIFKNSFITGISRIDCPYCYGSDKISYCSNGYAVRMLAVTLTGETFPLKKKPTGHDVICTREAYDFKAFIHNVTFENYFYENSLIPYCSGMSVFRRHNLASDGTGSHHLTNSVCNNCTKESWAYFEKPNIGWRGWFGGCGEIDCTGPNNYLISDQDGSFTGEQSQLLSNNSIVGGGEQSCEQVPEMNGHWCHTEQLAILEYESIAPDFNTRQMWPVELNYDGGNWTSVTNGWREWQWDGPQPMNRRLARFWSAIKLHQNYNLSYTSQPPSDSRFQIQKRLLPDGNNSDWVIIRTYFPVPNSIQVFVKNNNGTDQRVKPFPIIQNSPEDLNEHITECGANNYHYQNGTIEFVVNGIESCQVRIKLSSFVQLSARIDINIRDFYNNNGPTTFITNICAFLGIDTGRLKIVGVYQGSVVIMSQISSEPQPIDTSTSSKSQPQKVFLQLTKLSDKLKTGVSDNKIQLGGPILDFQAQVFIFNEDGSIYKSQQQQKEQQEQISVLSIILGVTLSLGIIIATVIIIYCKRKRAQIHEAEQIQNHSTVKRQVIQGSTEFDISATDQFGITSKSYSKWTINQKI